MDKPLSQYTPQDMQIKILNNMVDNLQEKNRKLEEQISSLEEDVQFLRALEAAGVDNWEGYSIANDILKSWNEDDGE